MTRTGTRYPLLFATLAALGGCAPATFAPAGFDLSSGYGAPWTAMSQCSMLGAGSPEAARMGIRSTAIQAGAIRGRLQRIQSNFRVGYSAGTTMEGWKRVASGDC